MIAFKNKMTPKELARLTGYTPQAINRWTRRFGWQTTPLHGVKGGRAHVVHVNADVRSFLLNTPLMRQRTQKNAAEPAVPYAGGQNTLEVLWVEALRQLTDEERQKLTALLHREGISGIFRRLSGKE
ncbi:putative DNA-binding transcriptional regulator [Jejubacter calystegiae]|uniref:Putative DNA-binding transcriptional regulator n=1 Tax=Jejubacter calystegiae TaxID=2579935 RepID=A0A4P8YN45_9ENTR|nr:YfeC-like transcriptional regulator [Jejubacter calystegiae]QCT22285.1 putative DNA-binding transcriptional regulator [Jejubacter calystegiae]